MSRDNKNCFLSELGRDQLSNDRDVQIGPQKLKNHVY